MKKVSGTYELTTRDSFPARLLRGTTITLRPDGRWVMSVAPDTILKRRAGTDSGTYRVRAGKIAVRYEGGFQTYVLRGDTLIWDPVERERRMAQTEAITGVKLVGQVETFYVRVQ